MVAAYAARHILTHRPMGPPPGPPPPVAGYTAWFDACRIVGQADNSALAVWPDSSGYGCDLTQPTPANRPTFYSSSRTVNGRPCVSLAGGAQMNSAAFAAVPQPTTIFAVGKLDALTSQYSSLIDGVNHRQGISAGYGIGGGTFYIFAGVAMAGPAWDTGLHLFTADFTGVPNAQVFTVDSTVGAPASAGNDSIDSFQVGAVLPYTWQGIACEIVFYPSTLTAPQQSSVQAYLKTKWGTP